MSDSGFPGELGEVGAGLLAVIGLGVSVLRWRHQMEKSHENKPDQVAARLAAILQFRATLIRCVPGLLVILLGAFYAFDRSNQHESDWWYGLLLIPIGWILILVLARKSWRRYKALQQV